MTEPAEPQIQTFRDEVDMLRIKAALNVEPDSDVPPTWTPEWVWARAVECCDVFSRWPMRWRPDTVRGFWPDVLLSEFELRDQNRVAERDEQQQRIVSQPDSIEISLAEEAAAWSMTYLVGKVGDGDLMGDALWTCAWCEATGKPLNGILKVRKQNAQRKAAIGGLPSVHHLRTGHVITHAAAQKFRQRACDVIALGLDRDGVKVR